MSLYICPEPQNVQHESALQGDAVEQVQEFQFGRWTVGMVAQECESPLWHGTAHLKMANCVTCILPQLEIFLTEKKLH